MLPLCRPALAFLSILPFPVGCTVGDEGVGKSALIEGLRGKNQGILERQGTGLEYTYLEAREEESEDIIDRVGIYTLDGDEDHSVFLQSVVTKDTLADVVVLIVVDLSRPWLIMDSLQKWSRVLADHLETLGAEETLETLKAEQVNTFRTYTENQDDAKRDGEETILLELDEGVLTSNHGIPLCIIGAKVMCEPSVIDTYALTCCTVWPNNFMACVP